MTLASILIVDADTQVRSEIAFGLRELGHEVSETSDASSALTAVHRQRPDLMVCDCTLPGIDGIELLGEVRGSVEFRAMRVLMTAEGGETQDIVSALQSGADDFVRKPLNMPEFLARVNACLRRPAAHAESREVKAGAIRVNTISQRVAINDSFLSLAPREYRLLLFLISNQDRVYSRKQLLLHVWDQNSSVGPRTVDVHIRRLRSLLQPFECDGYLQTVRGSGYRFSLQS